MEKILGEAEIRKRNQVTIPKDVCEYLNLKLGDKISLIMEHGQVVVKRVVIEHKDFDVKS